MSVMIHDDSVTQPDCKNSSAEAKVRALRPADLTKLLVANRTDSSSSMIETSGICCKQNILGANANVTKPCLMPIKDNRNALQVPLEKIILRFNCAASFRDGS